MTNGGVGVKKVDDKSRSLMIMRCGKTITGPTRSAELRIRLHNKSCDVCKKQNNK
tara:strand:+ start:678 stop:842 length:165 start_codon:yes stop_codon:yes gene_type:complete